VASNYLSETKRVKAPNKRRPVVLTELQIRTVEDALADLELEHTQYDGTRSRYGHKILRRIVAIRAAIDRSREQK
jgi:hypothetical protein